MIWEYFRNEILLIKTVNVSLKKLENYCLKYFKKEDGDRTGKL
jgi:hypothetical protein